jgi:ssRNA-specific RNase YbeY (16S rRNA maturation enzyme)
VDATVTEDGNLALGPFQAFWDAWSASDTEIKEKKLPHFSSAVAIQFEEMREHLEREDRYAAAREATDVISIALNTLRWMKFEPAEIAQIARNRARDRMVGKTPEILEKYEKQHGC